MGGLLGSIHSLVLVVQLPASLANCALDAERVGLGRSIDENAGDQNDDDRNDHNDGLEHECLLCGVVNWDSGQPERLSPADISHIVDYTYKE